MTWLSDSRTDSVISSSSRCGGRPLATSAARTLSHQCSSLNCNGDRLTATLTSPGQVAASMQDCRSTHSPIAVIRPDNSAIGMNASGEMTPSFRMMPPDQGLEAGDLVRTGFNQGLVVHPELVPRQRVAKADLQSRGGIAARRSWRLRRSRQCRGHSPWRRTARCRPSSAGLVRGGSVGRGERHADTGADLIWCPSIS